MRFACSLAPACAVIAASCSSSSAEPASATRRARPCSTCAVLVLTFMALINSQKRPMREPDYTVSQPRPECLNRLTSPTTDSLCCCCEALLNAHQTARLVTALERSNDYLVVRSPPPSP